MPSTGESRHRHRRHHSSSHRDREDEPKKRRRHHSDHRHHRHHRRRDESRSRSGSSSESGGSSEGEGSVREGEGSVREAAPVAPASESAPAPASEGTAPVPAAAPINWTVAREVVTSLLRALPALELASVFEMLDAGEALVLEGVGDPLLRAGLRALCAALGCEEEEVPDEAGGLTLALSAPAAVREAGLMRHLGGELQQGREDAAAAAMGPPPRRVLGPARPDAGALLAGRAGVEEEEEEEEVGPHLPGDARAEARAERAAQAQRDAAAAAAAAEATKARRAGGRKDEAHEAWMSMPSEELFGGGGPGAGNKYATKSAPNAGIGYAYLAKSAAPAAEAPAGAGAGAGAGAASRRYMDDVALARGGSLVEQHQRVAAAAPPAAGGAAAGGGAVPPPRRPFNRETDLQRPRAVRDPMAIVAKAGPALECRFSTGRFERPF